MDHNNPRAAVNTPPTAAPVDQPTKHPVDPGERYFSLDALRGFALLGILVPNIWAFAWPMAAMTNPTRVMSDAQPNLLAHDITSTAFLGKFMFLFALLFGSGVVMYSRKFDTADEQGKHHTKLRTGWHLWHLRCAVLLVFGLIHAYLFWFGDILTLYAVAGLTLLWWVRRLDPRFQFWGGLALYTLGALLMLAFILLGYFGYTQGEVTIEELTGGDPAREIAGYTGTFVDAFKTRFFTTLMMQLFFGIMVMPALWGIMVMGMGLTRLRILTGERSTRFYIVLAATLIPIGAALTLLAYSAISSGLEEISGFVWQGSAQFVGLPLAFGYAALVIALTKLPRARIITAPLAAVGRMALSNYFAHTLLCTTFFYGYGLGYFAKIEYPNLWLVVLSVWAFNIIFSMLWLRAFKMGPFEWLWRCLTYRQLVPIR